MFILAKPTTLKLHLNYRFVVAKCSDNSIIFKTYLGSLGSSITQGCFYLLSHCPSSQGKFKQCCCCSYAFCNDNHSYKCRFKVLGLARITILLITIESASGQSMKANGREPISCLGQVFNFKLDHFVMYAIARHIQKPLTQS